jgi:hypothetical protein
MSANGKRVVRPQHYGARSNSKNAQPQAGDEMGPFTHQQLLRFDTAFRTRLLRAFKTGRESRAAAEATYRANASRLRQRLGILAAATPCR